MLTEQPYNNNDDNSNNNNSNNNNDNSNNNNNNSNNNNSNNSNNNNNNSNNNNDPLSNLTHQCLKALDSDDDINLIKFLFKTLTTTLEFHNPIEISLASLKKFNKPSTITFNKSWYPKFQIPSEDLSFFLHFCSSIHEIVDECCDLMQYDCDSRILNKLCFMIVALSLGDGWVQIDDLYYEIQEINLDCSGNDVIAGLIHWLLVDCKFGGDFKIHEDQIETCDECQNEISHLKHGWCMMNHQVFSNLGSSSHTGSKECPTCGATTTIDTTHIMKSKYFIVVPTRGSFRLKKDIVWHDETNWTLKCWITDQSICFEKFDQIWKLNKNGNLKQWNIKSTRRLNGIQLMCYKKC